MITKELIKKLQQIVDEHESAVEIMKSRGYLRVYDCGNSVWEMK